LRAAPLPALRHWQPAAPTTSLGPVKICVALLLNAGLLAMLWPWLRRQWRHAPAGWRALLVWGLGARLAVAIYVGRAPVLDAAFMSKFGHVLTAQMWQNPAAALQTLLGNELHFQGEQLVYHGLSNTFFFIKLQAFCNLASLDTDWLNAVYLALFSFVACWQLARGLARAFPQVPAGAGLVAAVAWPSVIYWGSGLTKEAVVLGSGAGLLALVVRLAFGLRSARRSRVGRVALLIGLAALHFNMRYFFAMPLLGALSALGVVRVLQRLGLLRARWQQAVLMLALLVGGWWAAAEISGAFRLNKFTNQVMRIYGQNLATSLHKPHFEYPNLRPTPESIASHLPAAVLNALIRPWPGESAKLQYVAASCENLLLLGLLATALLAAWRRRSGHLPFALGLALAIHCLALAVLLGLSSPNLGTLHRYRSGLLPYLLLLLLQNDYAAQLLRWIGLGPRPSEYHNEKEGLR